MVKILKKKLLLRDIREEMTLIMAKIDISLTKMMKILETKTLIMLIFFLMYDKLKNSLRINLEAAAISNSDLHLLKFHRKLTLMSSRLKLLMIFLEFQEVRKKNNISSLAESQLLSNLTLMTYLQNQTSFKMDQSYQILILENQWETYCFKKNDKIQNQQDQLV